MGTKSQIPAKIKQGIARKCLPHGVHGKWPENNILRKTDLAQDYNLV